MDERAKPQEHKELKKQGRGGDCRGGYSRSPKRKALSIERHSVAPKDQKTNWNGSCFMHSARHGFPTAATSPPSYPRFATAATGFGNFRFPLWSQLSEIDGDGRVSVLAAGEPICSDYEHFGVGDGPTTGRKFPSPTSCGRESCKELSVKGMQGVERKRLRPGRTAANSRIRREDRREPSAASPTTVAPASHCGEPAKHQGSGPVHTRPRRRPWLRYWPIGLLGWRGCRGF